MAPQGKALFISKTVGFDFEPQVHNNKERQAGGTPTQTPLNNHDRHLLGKEQGVFLYCHGKIGAKGKMVRRVYR